MFVEHSSVAVVHVPQPMLLTQQNPSKEKTVTKIFRCRDRRRTRHEGDPGDEEPAYLGIAGGNRQACPYPKRHWPGPSSAPQDCSPPNPPEMKTAPSPPRVQDLVNDVNWSPLKSMDGGGSTLGETSSQGPEMTDVEWCQASLGPLGASALVLREPGWSCPFFTLRYTLEGFSSAVSERSSTDSALSIACTRGGEDPSTERETCSQDKASNIHEASRSFARSHAHRGGWLGAHRDGASAGAGRWGSRRGGGGLAAGARTIAR
ncbi:hypothetical protein P4O66_001258 [Electrophorus voltai]|uniref:Uncharacterized protein n=1 Tax=Electrophorus voltai TaxID=2609070 RepID=A0AAD8Z7N5_9TELE|nr:hypothetical protein P4O66_001258 [Electrophorus voltai]